ncbi:MAG: hypothetical protein CBB70_04540 [Planctomycetaceae bacterium TMED10]|nr:MAG: hypothetical protein CBB70_04540 [Planctomycetaceae bacterium TMED10]
MNVEVCCPDCGWTVSVDEAHLGKTGRCKSCNSRFKLELQTTPITDAGSGELDSLPTLSEPEAETESRFSSFQSPQSVGSRRKRNQLSTHDLPPKIREILWDNEELIYASRPEKNALIIKMIIGGFLSLFSLYLFPVVLLIVLLVTYFSWKNQYYLVTAERTIISKGIFNVAIKAIFNRHIIMISVNTGTIDRWLGLNSIQLATSAQGGAGGVMANFGLSKGCVELKYVKVGDIIHCYEGLRLS